MTPMRDPAKDPQMNSRDTGRHDDATPVPPLEILGKECAYREQGGADFTVTKVRLRDKSTDSHFNVHVVSVKDGVPGAICVAVRRDEGDNAEEEAHGNAGNTGGTGVPRLLIARHWRVATESFLWEFPRGMGETGENREQTALREFHEETGLTGSSARILQIVHADSGLLSDSTSVAEITVDFPQRASDDTDWELSEMRWLTPAQIDSMIGNGNITDSLTLSSYLIWRSRNPQYQA